MENKKILIDELVRNDFIFEEEDRLLRFVLMKLTPKYRNVSYLHYILDTL